MDSYQFYRGYNYDQAGNLTDLNLGGGETSAWTVEYNQLAMVDWNTLPDWWVTYGDDGAVSSLEVYQQGEWEYAYDDENRLTGVWYTPYGQATEQRYSCTYDAFGRPAVESFSPPGQQPVTRYLVWEGDELLMEVGPTGTVLVRHVWGAGGYQGYYRETSLTRLALRDGLGHVRGLMNTSKSITDRYVFDAYGNDVAPGLHNTTEGNPFAQVLGMPLSMDSKSLRSDALRFRWNGSYGYRTLYLLSGQQTTNTATLMHVGARHYSPSLRRWLQRDPIDLAGGSPNLYAYAQGDPVNSADPSGLQSYQPRSAEQLLADLERQTKLLAEHLEVYNPCDDPGQHHKEIRGIIEGLADDINTVKYRKLATDPRFVKVLARGQELIRSGYAKLEARAARKAAEKVALRKLEKLLIKAGIKYTLHCVPIVNAACLVWDVYDLAMLMVPLLDSGPCPRPFPSVEPGGMAPPGGGSFYRPGSGWIQQ